ncbi:MAG: hypothetical protein ACKVQT_33275 [Burkholderiales bacterium]
MNPMNRSTTTLRHARPIRAPILAALSIVCISRAFAAEPSCPAMTVMPLESKITASDRAARFDGGGVALVKTLRIDTDGAATAYHPENIGTTHLCNGMNPYVDGRCLGVGKADLEQCYPAIARAQAAGWDRERSPTFCVYGFEAPSSSHAGQKKLWGGKFGDGPLPLQGAGDPAPGFFISLTASQLPIKPGMSRVSANADADRVPYVVVPSSFVGAQGPSDQRAGAALMRVKDRHLVGAMVADAGGAIGEVSVAAAQLISDPAMKAPVPITVDQLRSKKDLPFPYVVSSGFVRAYRNPDDGPYLVFAFSTRFGRADEYTKAKADQLSAAAFERFGGAESLAKCAIAFLQK